LSAWLRFCHCELAPDIAFEILCRFECDIEALMGDRAFFADRFANSPKLLDRCLAMADRDVTGDLKYIEEHQIRVIPFTSPGYPQKLKYISDPPCVLFVKGGADLNTDAPVLAVVGSRHADYYGLYMAETITRDLSKNGFVIVSGGARGIDSAAHRGSLKGKGVTWSVFGCGIGVDYPPENSLLFMDIAEAGGALISEYHPKSKIDKYKFPLRNRIIAGLCDAILVIQAPVKSGSLITAALAREYGKDVFAVPGNADNDNNSGTNLLIKDGCPLVENADDVAFNMGYTVLLPPESAPDSLSEAEKAVFDCISTIPVGDYALSEKTGLPTEELSGVLTSLEVKGVVKRVPGNRFVRSVLS
ncbi:MAG: DNA-processing protein DprA, partial [Abditibacteriota bacterium]|nr:DNA-processing protein DprA [Abditibacteriota bacterium]